MAQRSGPFQSFNAGCILLSVALLCAISAIAVLFYNYARTQFVPTYTSFGLYGNSVLLVQGEIGEWTLQYKWGGPVGPSQSRDDYSSRVVGLLRCEGRLYIKIIHTVDSVFSTYTAIVSIDSGALESVALDTERSVFDPSHPCAGKPFIDPKRFVLDEHLQISGP